MDNYTLLKMLCLTPVSVLLAVMLTALVTVFIYLTVRCNPVFTLTTTISLSRLRGNAFYFPKLKLACMKPHMFAPVRYVLVLLLVMTASFVKAQTATVQTEFQDYPPGSIVNITGSGFTAGETVALQVLHYDANGDNDTSAAHQPWNVVADASGNIVASWTVPPDQDELGATLLLTADGKTSGLHAEWTFTDNYTVYPDGISINSTTLQSVCVGTSATQLTATINTCSNGGGGTGTQTAITYKWYYNTTSTNNIIGATLVQTTTTTTATTSDSYTPLSTSSEIGTRYYFCQVTFTPQGSGNGCGGSGRNGYPYTTSTVKVVVNTQSAPPTLMTSSDNNYCPDAGGNITLTVSGGALGTGAVVKWYTGSCGGTFVGAGNPLTIAKPTTTTTYYARYEGDCNTTDCLSYLVTVKTLSDAPTLVTSSDNNFCANASGDITLTASGGTLGTGAVVKWYSGSCGGTLVGTGNPLTIAKPTSTTTYYARYEGECNTTDCLSYLVTVKPPFSSGSIETAGETICPGGDPGVIGSATNASGGDGSIFYKWQSNGIDIPGSNSATYDPPAGLTQTTTYTRYAYDGTCNTAPVISGGSWTVTVKQVFSYVNLQFPESGTSCQGNGFDVYGRVYAAGVTEAAGAGANITAELGYSTTNTDPSTWTNWVNASFNVQAGNNDEYKATLNLLVGTYYYAFRYTLNGCTYQYGGINGFWSNNNDNGVLTVAQPHSISLSSGDNNQTVCYNTAIGDIKYTVGGGATGAGVTGLPTGVTGSYSNGSFTISGIPIQYGTFNYIVTTTGPAGCPGAVATGTITIKQIFSYVNLQFPASGTSCQGDGFDVYGRVYAAGVTEAAGPGANITAELGYSTTNTDPSTWTNWVNASFNVQAGNNDEYKAALNLPVGTYYYAFRYTLNGCTYQYGGINGFWSNDNDNGVLTVAQPHSISLSSGDNNQTVCYNTAIGDIKYTVGGGATGAGVTGLPTGVTGSYSNGSFTISGTPSQYGTFNYTVTTTGPAGCPGAVATGTITVKQIFSYVNLQSPSGGTVCQGTGFDVYGQVYAAGVTEAAGAGANITAELGYSTTNGDPSLWTNWIPGTYNAQGGINNNNDEYKATLNLPTGIYYYAFRYTLNGCTYQYGGINGFWSKDNDNGVLTVNEAPVITTTYSDITVNNDPGVCGATVTYAAATVTGTPTPSVTYSTASGSVFPVGETIVTVTATNSCGTDTKTFKVTVIDAESPVLADPADVTGNNDAGYCYKVVNLTAPLASDNCGIDAAGVTASGIPADNKFPVGTTTVTWSVTDIHGHTTTQTQDITITDAESPVLADPADVTGDNDAGYCYKVVNLTAPFASDNCGIDAAGVTASGIPADNKFPVGTTTVTWSVTDIHGHTTTQTQDITITDNEVPTITAPATVNVNNDAGQCSATVSDLGIPATGDNCGVQSVTNDHPSTTYPVGTTVVTWTVTDIHGHTATATQNVVVTDNEVPTITAPATVNVNNDGGQCSATVSDLGIPATDDNCGVQSVTNDHPSTTYPVGTTVVTWTVTDIHGHTATATQNVVVTDTEKPIVVTKNISVALDATGIASFTTSQVNDGSSDNCGIQSSSLDVTSFNCSQLGDHTVTLTVTDIHGNSNSGTAIVTVTPYVVPSTDITLTVTPAQYSDNATFSATIKNGVFSNCNNSQAAIQVSFYTGTQLMGTVNLTASGTDLVGTLTTTLLDPANSSEFNPCAGNKTVKAVFSGISNAFSIPNEVSKPDYVIAKEDADVNYTGTYVAAIPSTTSTTAPVVLSATIKDALDGYNGDIRKARVKFIIKDYGNNVLPTSVYNPTWFTPSLINASDLTVGTVSTTWNAPYNSDPSKSQYTISVIVDCDGTYGYYNGMSSGTILYVINPCDASVNGGGYLVETNSVGVYSAESGTNANYGFNVKYQKNKGYQGDFNCIIRQPSTGKQYQVKSTSIKTLVTNGSKSAGYKASFTAIANVYDISNPNIAPVLVSQNNNLTVTLKDNGEPGTNDMLGITLLSSGGSLLFSSNWDGTATADQLIGGGNLQVQNGCNTNLACNAQTATNTLDLNDNPVAKLFEPTVGPNPSANNFRLQVISTFKEDIKVTIVDISGRLIKQMTMRPYQTIQFGNEFMKGAYMMHVIQGDNRRTIKLIKL